jgi:hypothetical protein
MELEEGIGYAPKFGLLGDESIHEPLAIRVVKDGNLHASLA